jgi:hypothetical protein
MGTFSGIATKAPFCSELKLIDLSAKQYMLKARSQAIVEKSYRRKIMAKLNESGV